jgi:hypothetical protein
VISRDTRPARAEPWISLGLHHSDAREERTLRTRWCFAAAPDWSGGVLLAVIAGAGLIIYVAAEVVNWAHATGRWRAK